jgi:geranylgeranyl diphosphate synthase type I
MNAGTAMRVLASLAILDLQKRGFSSQKQIEAQRLLDESCLRMLEGQYLDISYESRLDIGVADYLDMIDRKTAALIECALEMGALLGVEDGESIERFGNFGRDLGLAFQMRDDFLGIWGEEVYTGKPRGNDIRRRKKSLPVVYALERSVGGVGRELISIYQKEVIGEADLEIVLRELEVLKARTFVQEMAEAYCQRALLEIEGLELLPLAKKGLEELSHFLIERDF